MPRGRPRKQESCLEPMRRCHDCGRPTRDYRCPQCQEKHLAQWRKAQGIHKSSRDDDDNWYLDAPEL